MSSLHIISLNVRGLRNKAKREVVFSHLCSISFSLCLLQEVHLKDEEDVKLFSKEWTKGDSRWSIGGVHSSGVGTLSGNQEVHFVGSFSVVQGRVLVTDIDWKGMGLRVLNIYAHASPKERRELFLSLDTVFMTNRHVVIGGDFNSQSEGSKAEAGFINIVTKYNLVDSYKKVNPDDLGITWSNSRGAKSRIDYIFCPVEFQVTGAKVSPVFYTDHNMLSVKLNSKMIKSGKGYWKLNNNILEVQQFRLSFKCFLKECIHMKVFYDNVCEWWESTKLRITYYIQNYSKESRKDEFKSYYQLQKSISKLMELRNAGGQIDEDLLKQMQNKQRLFFQNRAEAFKFRCHREKWESDEKCSPYFFRQSKAQAKRRRIVSVLNVSDEEINDPDGMAEVISGHFSKFFLAEKVDYKKGTTLLDNIDRFIPKDLRTDLDKDFTLEEILKATTSLKNGKVPGIDGITKELYIIFWEDIGPQLLELFTYICKSGIMGESMRKGVISLLFKKGDANKITNYRPLTMLCTDYKIFSKVLTNRLVSVLPFVIGSDQTCAVPGRQLNWNLQMHRDILSYSQDRNIPLIVLSLDQEKAFDRVDHGFLFRTLEKFGFGVRFRSWLRILYTEVGSRVNVNGNLGEFFKQTRGVRQGCPASAPLYVLFIEILACAIRKNGDIKGIQLPGGEKLTISQYADDTVLYLKDDFCLREAMQVIDMFSSASGSKMNTGKSQIKYLGKWRNRVDNPLGLSLCAGPMTVLGISFGNDNDGETNWETKLGKVLKKLNMWKLRRLSMSGKVLVIKSDLLPTLLHMAYVFPMPALVWLKLQKALFNFIWGGYEYIKRATMYQPIERGGRDMPNLGLKFKVLFFSNICKIMLYPPEHKCQPLINFWLAIHLRPLVVKWDNSFPKAEVMPDHYNKIIRWAKKYEECWNRDSAVNHKKLYTRLIAKFDPKDGLHVPTNVWRGTQCKSLENRLRDFNWLVLHSKLAVRSTLFKHNLTLNKMCPRDGCNGEETVEHALFECPFAKHLWEKLGQRFGFLKDVTWAKVLYMDFKLEGEKKGCKALELASVVKAKLWETRCSIINGTEKWSIENTTQSIEVTMQRKLKLEASKWGIDAIKDRWKIIFENL